MYMKVNEFFTGSNLVKDVTVEDYKHIIPQVDSVRSFARISNQKLYVIDYYKKGFLYVSDQFAEFCGMSSDDVIRLGFGLYEECVPNDDLRMLMDINNKQLELLETFSAEEKGKYALCGDFHFESRGRMRTVYHKLTPLAMKDGKLWLALCAVSLSSNERSGNMTIVKEEGGSVYKYDTCNMRWIESDKVVLNDMELDVITRTMKGMTVSLMSSFIYKTKDTIKSCKKKLFSKLGVKNMHEALIYIINNHMW